MATVAPPIRIRDLLLGLLVWGMRLSKPDAVAILNLGAMTEWNARYRLEKCLANVAETFEELRREVGGRLRPSAKPDLLVDWESHAKALDSRRAIAASARLYQ